MNQKLKCLLLSLITVAFVSCNSPKTAEDTLEKYVDQRFSNRITEENIGEYLAGKLMDDFNVLKEEGKNTYLNLETLKLKSFKIINQSCKDRTCYITYIISYTSLKDKKVAFKTKVKKIAELQEYEEGWRIDDIKNVKTFHSATEEISADI
jgi:hypothetical protein